jgi:hypothetical protein
VDDLDVDRESRLPSNSADGGRDLQRCGANCPLDGVGLIDKKASKFVGITASVALLYIASLKNWRCALRNWKSLEIQICFIR